ncbi:hypothetical protein KQH40_00715 [bacterium]|nr:hypothetical protein [bacterium]
MVDVDVPYWHGLECEYRIPGYRGTSRGWFFQQAVERSLHSSYSPVYDRLFWELVDWYEKELKTFWGLGEFLERCDLHVGDQELWEMVEKGNAANWLMAEAEIDLDEWLHEEASWELSNLFQDAQHAAHNDIDYALSIGLYDERVSDIFGLLKASASAAGLYHLANIYLRMAAAIGIEPESIESEIGLEASVADIDSGGICPECGAVIPELMELNDSWGEPTECLQCGSAFSLREAALTWLFKSGRITEPLQKLLSPSNRWIVWPEELSVKASPTILFGRTCEGILKKIAE